MKHTLKLSLIAGLAAAAAMMTSPPEASAVLIGITAGGPHTALTVSPDAVTAAGFAQSWTLGSEQAPVSVDYLASNGFALTVLQGSPVLVIGQQLQLHEFIKIGDGATSWINWNQKFVTDGFNFIGGTLKVNGNILANGIVSQPSAQTINFFFNALSPGTILEITKTITWMGNLGGDSGSTFQGQPNTIDFEQFPTIGSNDITPVIPEPASLALVGLAVSLFGAAGKFRGRKRMSQV